MVRTNHKAKPQEPIGMSERREEHNDDDDDDTDLNPTYNIDRTPRPLYSFIPLAPASIETVPLALTLFLSLTHKTFNLHHRTYPLSISMGSPSQTCHFAKPNRTGLTTFAMRPCSHHSAICSIFALFTRSKRNPCSLSSSLRFTLSFSNHEG